MVAARSWSELGGEQTREHRCDARHTPVLLPITSPSSHMPDRQQYPRISTALHPPGLHAHPEAAMRHGCTLARVIHPKMNKNTISPWQKPGQP